MAPIKRKAESKPPIQRVARAMEPLDNVTVKVTKREANTEIETLTKRLRGAGRKEAATEIEIPRKRRRVAADVELLGDLTVKGTKKEAATEVKTLTKRRRGPGGQEAATEIETPRKRRRVAADVELLSDVTVKGAGKEAATETETPRKRRRVATDVELLGNVTVKGAGKEAATETETPRKRRRVATDVELRGDVTVKGAKKEAASEVKTLTKRRRDAGGKEAATEIETPRKRRRVAADVELLGDVTVKGTKKEAATEVKTLRGAGGKEATTEIETPHEKQSDGNNAMLMGHTNIDHFKAMYMQQGLIGKGGFGVVYAGIRRSDELPVAIKYIRASAMEQILLTDNGTQSWYPLEVSLMLTATGGPQSVGKSPAVSLLDWYRLGKEVIMVMERPEPCVTLRKFLKRTGPMKKKLAKVIMKQLVDAAIHLQAYKVFHRDLKLENILIETGPDGLRVRIIDFGCGCYLEDKHYTLVSGTPEYLPPEFYIRHEYMGRPTTVWQLGAILFQLLTGNREFTTSSFLRKDIEILTEWSQDCQDLLNKCLAIDPRGRANLYQIRQHPWLN
ncbi:aurora kinase B-like isoform X1 [Paralichthys olivaceus]|uniref:aurora kinase B-like isoform X1 n=1 Tax=Paralichthys olivaceus TaxID=8255 RepID=UPI003750DF7B